MNNTKEVFAILQMAQFVGVTLSKEELVAAHDKGVWGQVISDHLWDVVADSYEFAVVHEANLAELVADLESPEPFDPDFFGDDEIPF